MKAFLILLASVLGISLLVAAEIWLLDLHPLLAFPHGLCLGGAILLTIYDVRWASQHAKPIPDALTCRDERSLKKQLKRSPLRQSEHSGNWKRPNDPPMQAFIVLLVCISALIVSWSYWPWYAAIPFALFLAGVWIVSAEEKLIAPSARVADERLKRAIEDAGKLHEWGCKCLVCGATRDDDHDWDGCRCRVCGAQRDEGHLWEYCQCTVCGKQRDEEHRWEYCRCAVCSAARDAEHQWEGCICVICKEVKHQWEGCKCVSCGAQRDQGHRWAGDRCDVCGKAKLFDRAEIPAKLKASRPAIAGSMMMTMLAGGGSSDVMTRCPRCGDRHSREDNQVPVRRYSSVDVALLSDVGGVSVVQCPTCGVTYEVIH